MRSDASPWDPRPWTTCITDASVPSTCAPSTARCRQHRPCLQDHYDYGLRSFVIPIARAAGALKRADPDASEEVIMYRTMLDLIKPKLVYLDLPLFMALLSDLFPGVELPVADGGELRAALEADLLAHGYQIVPEFIVKMIQVRRVEFEDCNTSAVVSLKFWPCRERLGFVCYVGVRDQGGRAALQESIHRSGCAGVDDAPARGCGSTWLGRLGQPRFELHAAECSCIRYAARTLVVSFEFCLCLCVRGFERGRIHCEPARSGWNHAGVQELNSAGFNSCACRSMTAGCPASA